MTSVHSEPDHNKQRERHPHVTVNILALEANFRKYTTVDRYQKSHLQFSLKNKNPFRQHLFTHPDSLTSAFAFFSLTFILFVCHHMRSHESSQAMPLLLHRAAFPFYPKHEGSSRYLMEEHSHIQTHRQTGISCFIAT